MNRARFMEALERMLADIPEAERREALDFYENYFEDAGPEAEDRILQELGSPGKVAAVIRAEINGDSGDFAEYTEHGYQDSRMMDDSRIPAVREGARRENGRKRNYQRQFDRYSRKAEEFSRRVDRERRRRGISSVLVLAIIFLILISPFLKGAAAVAVAVLLLPVIVTVALTAGAVGLLIFGIALVVSGFAAMFSGPAVGVLMVGIGFLVLAFGILVGIAALWAAGKGVVGIFRKVTDLISGLLNRRRGEVR